MKEQFLQVQIKPMNDVDKTWLIALTVPDKTTGKLAHGYFTTDEKFLAVWNQLGRRIVEVSK